MQCALYIVYIHCAGLFVPSFYFGVYIYICSFWYISLKSFIYVPYVHRGTLSPSAFYMFVVPCPTGVDFASSSIFPSPVFIACKLYCVYCLLCVCVCRRVCLLASGSFVDRFTVPHAPYVTLRASRRLDFPVYCQRRVLPAYSLPCHSLCGAVSSHCTGIKEQGISSHLLGV